MKYYKRIENGNVTAVGTACGGTEINKAEYDALLAEFQAKHVLAEQLYGGLIGAQDIPDKWREEIALRVEMRRAEEAEALAQEATDEDYLAALQELGVSV